VRGGSEGEQDRALGERRGVLRRRRDHHALGDVLGDGLVARGGEGSGVDERETVHAAIVAVTGPSRHRPDG
jgi:hypothetical protein